MRVTVVGAGAIGTLIATWLQKAGAEVTLVARAAYRDALARTPLEVLLPDGEVLRASVHVVDEGDLGPTAEETDVLVITVKAYDTAPLADALRGLSRPPYVLTLQNGVGNEEAFASAVGEDRVLSGALTTPVHVTQPGRVRVARPSFKVGLAPVRSTHEALARLRYVGDALAAGGFRVRYASDYRGLKWSKLLMNMTANAQSALLGWTPARVFAHPLSGRLEVYAWKEALEVMAALHISAIPCGGYPLPLALPLVRRLPASWVRPLMGRFAAGGRGEKMPSLYLDLERGRRRTEAPWLNGAVARAAARVGVPARVNETLERLVEEVARGVTDREMFRDRPERIWAAVQGG